MNSPRKRFSTIHRGTVFGKRQSQFQKNIEPLRLFVSNDKYYTYNLEQVDINSIRYKQPIDLSPEVGARLKLMRASIKEPMILSYQKVNQITYKIAKTLGIIDLNENYSDHNCVVNYETMRCNHCGCLMGWLFCYGSLFPPYKLDLYEYEEIFTNCEQIINDESENNLKYYIPIKSVRSIPLAKKFLTYMCERPPASSFEELYYKYKEKNYFPNQLVKEFGLSYKEMLERDNPNFRIYADFECGNLQGYEYGNSENVKILLRGDTNNQDSSLHSWFYFKVFAKNNIKIQFELQNLKLKTKIYESGGGIFVYDEKNNDNEYGNSRKEWRNYYQEVFLQTNEVRGGRYLSVDMDGLDENSPTTKRKINFRSLFFSYEFKENSEALFAFSRPYSYSDLLTFLTKQEKKLFSKPILDQEFDMITKHIFLKNSLVKYSRSVLVSSRCGLPIFLIKISASEAADETNEYGLLPNSSKKKKKGIVFIARQHPMEASSSFVIEGIISFLISDNSIAINLRAFFDFYIIPMINTDGVILGNSITGTSGRNFNRIWDSPSDFEPEVKETKKYIQELQKKQEILYFLDFHSNYKKQGAYLIGNPPFPIFNNSNIFKNIENLVEESGLNMLLAQLLADESKYFKLEECIYSINAAGRDKTARWVFHKDLKIRFCYSIETSLFNYVNKETGEIKNFNVDDYKNFGKEILLSLFKFSLLLSENETPKLKGDEKIKKKISPIKKKQKLTKREEQIKLEEENLERERYFYRYLLDLKSKILNVKVNWQMYFTDKELKKMKKKAMRYLNPNSESIIRNISLTAIVNEKDQEKTDNLNENSSNKNSEKISKISEEFIKSESSLEIENNVYDDESPILKSVLSKSDLSKNGRLSKRILQKSKSEKGKKIRDINEKHTIYSFFKKKQKEKILDNEINKTDSQQINNSNNQSNEISDQTKETSNIKSHYHKNSLSIGGPFLPEKDNIIMIIKEENPTYQDEDERLNKQNNQNIKVENEEILKIDQRQNLSKTIKTNNKINSQNYKNVENGSISARLNFHETKRFYDSKKKKNSTHFFQRTESFLLRSLEEKKQMFEKIKEGTAGQSIILHERLSSLKKKESNNLIKTQRELPFITPPRSKNGKMRLKRPCGMGLLPIDPFIKSKSQLRKIYSINKRNRNKEFDDKEKTISQNKWNVKYDNEESKFFKS